MDFHSSIFILLDFVPKDFAEVFCFESFDTDTWFRWTSDFSPKKFWIFLGLGLGRTWLSPSRDFDIALNGVS